MKIGIVGGGQLGRMLALAGYPLGLTFRVLDPAPDAPASQLAEHVCGDFDDPAVLDEFAEGLDIATYEFENVPALVAERLAERLPVFPPAPALAAAQDRLAEKTLFTRLGIPVAPHERVDSAADLERAVRTLGLPSVLKTRRFGYDGKGQVVLRAESDLPLAWERLGGVPLILEGFLRFERELSILAVRDRAGNAAVYPLVENHHRDGILRRTIAPAPALTRELQRSAERYASEVMGALDYVGVLAIELFQVDGQLIANEMAPRVHNSGHWTIEAARTSQFENHLRAVCGLPLGPTDPIGHSEMLNLIGTAPPREAVLGVPGAHLHLYAKSDRPGRKIGHVTIHGDDAARVRELAARVERVIAP